MFGTAQRPVAMPMDAYRKGDSFVVRFDLPGVDAGSIDLTVERNVLTVRAERKPPAVEEEIERVVGECSYGTFTRQVFLGETLQSDRLTADYTAGVLTITIPIAEEAKPRKIQISGSDGRKEIAT